MVGTHIIKSLRDHHVDPILSPEERAALKGVGVALFFNIIIGMRFVCVCV